jgi:RNA polymerase sigma-70 factor (ECF subfamily)
MVRASSSAPPPHQVRRHPRVASKREGAWAGGDGGGRPPSWPRPIVGRDRVARLLAAVGRQMATMRLPLESHQVNGQPGAVILHPEGRIVSVFSLDVCDGAVQTVRSVINHDKLGHLGPLADIPALLQAWNAREP